MKYNRLGKWGDNAIAHWGHKEYTAAKDEITLAIESAVSIKDAEGVPKEVLERLKQQKKDRRGRK